MLSLNLANEREKYREFYGRNTDQMPLLLASGRVPISSQQFMQRRLEVRSADFGKQYKGTAHEASVRAVRDDIWTNYVDTGDGVLYHPNGRIKVVTDAAFLRALTPKSRPSKGAVVLDDGIWSKLTDAPEFTREQVEKDRFATVWLALARDDKALLAEYRKAVAAELKARHNYAGENMGVWLADAQNVTTGRVWCFHKGYYSNALGNYLLGYVSSRFVGVAPEAQGQALEQRL